MYTGRRIKGHKGIRVQACKVLSPVRSGPYRSAISDPRDWKHIDNDTELLRKFASGLESMRLQLLVSGVETLRNCYVKNFT